MPVSLIMTVLNEGQSLRPLLEGIRAQTRQPDEIIVVDGGSTDSTLSTLEEYKNHLPLHILVEEGANISRGRNLAIQNATYDLLAITDAGVRLHPEWLERITAPFTDETVKVVAGFFLPDVHTPFEVAMGATVLPLPEDINPATFMPSSRSVAVRRETFQQAGGYPEWLDYCEDLILDFRLDALAGPFYFEPAALVYFKPRTTLKAFIKQYYLYARGDGKANIFFRRHLIRYLTYLVVLPAILLSALYQPLTLLLLLAGGAYLVGRPYIRLTKLWADLSPTQKLIAVLWVPIIRIIGDLAKMAGYPVGLLWRAKNHPPDWRP